MGTNYYWIGDDNNHCEHCGRFDEGEHLHIGKSSVGWTFSFHGTDEIRSYGDWLEYFASHKGHIKDEYKRTVELREFIAMVRAKEGEPNNQSIYCRTHHLRGDYWLDEDGHSFSGGEFS